MSTDMFSQLGLGIVANQSGFRIGTVTYVGDGLAHHYVQLPFYPKLFTIGTIPVGAANQAIVSPTLIAWDCPGAFPQYIAIGTIISGASLDVGALAAATGFALNFAAANYRIMVVG